MRRYRADKMSSFIRAVISNVISQKVNDPRISPFATVTRVEMSADLLVAKVYISVMGPPEVERRTMAGLEHAAGHIQRLVGSKLSTRNVPELRFITDGSIKGAAETIRLIDESLKDVGGSVAEERPEDSGLGEEDEASA